MKQVDFLIAGQGIAGTVFSYTAIKAGYTVHVVDTPMNGMASLVAGGLINPITGRFIKKSWMVDQLFPAMQQLYREMDAMLGIHSFREMPIIRLLENEADRQLWASKRALNDHLPYMGDFIALNDEHIRLHHAAAMVLQGGWLDTALLMGSWRNHLRGIGALNEEKINPAEVRSGQWKDISFRHLVFCEGWLGYANPFFQGLQLNAAKGEVLVVEMPELNWDFVINKNMLIIPLGNGLYKVGATVEHTTELSLLNKSLEELERKLQSVVNVPYKIRERMAGFRPTVKDRRPLMGMSDQMENIWLFNGLGTKGVSLAPYMASHLLQHITEGSELMPVADWRRFHKK